MQHRWTVIIKTFRERRGYTQEALAFAIGVSQRTVSRWERGVDSPSMQHQKKLRDLGWQPPGYFFDALAHSVAQAPVARALTMTDRLRLLAVSRPAIIKRPSIVNWIGKDLNKIAGGVLRDMLDDRALQRSIRRREIASIQTITTGVLRTEDKPITEKFATTITFFYEDGTVFRDAVSSPAPANATCGYWPVAMDVAAQRFGEII
jgi:transcriptional regulator with XRE-family HTH domain